MALLPAGSGQHRGAACGSGCQRTGLEERWGARELRLVSAAQLAQVQCCAGCCRELDRDDLPDGGKRLQGGGMLRVRSVMLAVASLAFIKAFFRALLKPFQM